MNLHHSADRRRTTLVVTAGVAALAMLAWLAIGQTRAIFSGVTSNNGNTLGTGSVTLEDNRGTALFDLSGMLPGNSQTQTIQISNPSKADMGLRLFGENFATDDDGDDTNGAGPTDMADYLDLLVTVDAPDGTPKTVFEGTLEQFAAAVDYSGGWWTCKATPETCPHQPVNEQYGPGGPTPPPPVWMGLLETTLRDVLPPEVEEDERLADFWAAVQAVDLATKAQQEQVQETVENPPSPSPSPVPTPTGSPSPLPTPTENPEPPTLAELWGQVPDTVKEPLPDDAVALIDSVVNGGGGSSSAMAADDGGMQAQADAAVSTPAERGDRINAVNEAWSIRTYTFTITMNADAGQSENVGPNHRASITFVWEGRA